MAQMIMLPENYDGEKVNYQVYCYPCSSYTTLILPFRNFHSWRNGEYVQNAFPYLSPAQREMIVSGTHSKCFDELFKEE
jgi:hypothetical protein